MRLLCKDCLDNLQIIEVNYVGWGSFVNKTIEGALIYSSSLNRYFLIRDMSQEFYQDDFLPELLEFEYVDLSEYVAEPATWVGR